jgi:hypothetical protein
MRAGREEMHRHLDVLVSRVHLKWRRVVEFGVPVVTIWRTSRHVRRKWIGVHLEDGRRKRMGDLLQTSELLLETLQFAADGNDVAAAAAPGEGVADGTDLFPVGSLVDELVLPVLQGVHDGLELVLNVGRGLLVVLEDDVAVHGRSQNEDHADEQLHGRSLGQTLWVSFTLYLLGLGQWAQY